MSECPNCERYKASASAWRNVAYRVTGHPLPWSPDDELLQRALKALYTSPPASKPWVGLDQHDIDVLFLNEDGVRFARYIEAKLKEKNT